MIIEYRDTREFDRDTLRDLFESVHWDSARYPDRLQLAIRNSAMVYSAWDGDRLVGLINALSDGAMTAYFHYLLVHPEYQRQGIGRHLLTLMLEYYRDYYKKALIAEESAVEFYRKCGFMEGENARGMFLVTV
jgi:ribosomal protein S18 acetylase RimI-like enzyme